MLIKFNLFGQYCNSWPILKVLQHNEVVYEQEVIEQTKIELDLPATHIQFGMSNKSFGQNRRWDTKMDSNRNIIADKIILINSIHLDDVDITHLLSHIKYSSLEHGPLEVHDKAIRFNGSWSLDISNNTYDYIIGVNNNIANEINKDRKFSYFSNFSIVGDYSEHHETIEKIKSYLK